MKQTVPWVIAGTSLAVAIVSVSGVMHSPTKTGTAAAPASTGAPAMSPAGQASEVPEGPVAYTFADEDKLKEFVRSWQQRQAMVFRLAVLKDYWDAEEKNLKTITDGMVTSYGIDPAKNYTLDKEKKSLVELPAPVEPGKEPPAATEQKVVHTFADEQAVTAFATEWQQRQSVTLRMAVLKAYWDREQASLKQMNEKLAADYRLDTTKDYFLNSRDRTLIERPAPPAPALGQGAPGQAAPSGSPAAQAQPASR